MSYPIRVVPPMAVIDAMLTSTNVPEVAPAAYSGGTTYAAGVEVSVAGAAGLVTIYVSLQNGNTGHAPASSPTWWALRGTVYQAYSGGTTYALGDRVQDNTAHVIYESAVAGNLGQPLSDTTKWVRVSATNRWALFDTSNSTQTARSTSMNYTLALAGGINALGALGLTGVNTMRVQITHPTYGTLYDQTLDLASLPSGVGWWQWLFGARTAPMLAVITDLPSLPGCTLTVDFTGTTELAVGTLIFGEMTSIGLGVQQGARVGIQDFSRVETDAFGETVLVQRAFAKRATFDIPIARDMVDDAINFLSSVRATPCLWIGSPSFESTVIFGIYKEFDVNLAYYNVSECSLQIQGMT